MSKLKLKNKILKILKWYAIYHIVVDICFLVAFFILFPYDSGLTFWHNRITNEPILIVKLLLLGPLTVISMPFHILYMYIS